MSPARPATEPLARVRGVTHRYGRRLALDEVSLDVSGGRTLGLIGPDGVGKSTLLGLIAGARRLQVGEVETLGGDMADAHWRATACRRIAYMPQGLGRSLYPELTVRENVNLFGALFGLSPEERERAAAELLASTGLDAFPDRRAAALSGGMKQKLGLCCALIHTPDLLILDEPTTGVDPLSRRQFWELIARIRARRPGIGLVVATAYMEEAERFDDLVMMTAGRVLDAGSPADLMRETGTDSLEDAYIALLPPQARGTHRALEIPPYEPHGEGPAIAAENLTRRFGDFVAVDRASFEIAQGEIFGFVGPNGCGKTTTMKMLTGLLPASAGRCSVFGHPVRAGDVEVKRRLGYMSQSFSLYGELTVRQNLRLHARLFHLPAEKRRARIADLTVRCGLREYLDVRAESLPVGIRQRLSLAVAVIHEPEILILDEPTSGVDPIARDAFWALLVELSRRQGVTIFVSTHFMNEAERCDRIAFMDAGRVLACDAPSALSRQRGAATLEDAFIDILAASRGEAPHLAPRPSGTAVARPAPKPPRRGFSWARLLAVAGREVRELARDPVRLVFCALAPLMLMLALGYGLSFDVEDLTYVALDRDRTLTSRSYLEKFSGSPYFLERPPVLSHAESDRMFQAGQITLAIEIPPGFGRDVKRDSHPEVGVWIDGGMPFLAETVRGYVHGLHQEFLTELAREVGRPPPSETALLSVVTRFRYNQDLRSVFAMVPGIMGLILVLVPTMLTAVGVARERELGSITNLYVTPLTRAEFLFGKQLPYIAISLLNFLILVGVAIALFGVPLKGSFTALALGTLIYVTATTSLGLVISSFCRTQIAAVVAATILTILPTVLLSGLIGPVSSLTGSARVMSRLFPGGYFHQISVGTFTKDLAFADFLVPYIALCAFVVAYSVLGLILLRKQAA